MSGQHWRNPIRGARWQVFAPESRSYVFGWDELGFCVHWTPSRAEAETIARSCHGIVVDADELEARGPDHILALLGARA